LKHLDAGNAASSYPDIEKDSIKQIDKELGLITAKEVIYVANVDEGGLSEDNDYVKQVAEYAAKKKCEVIKISAKVEEELVGLDDSERVEFLASYGVEQSGLEQIIKKGFKALGLISYLTAGPKEVRAWTIHEGWRAPQAASVIHTDFEKGFIRAEVISYADFVRLGSEAACKQAGVMRVEGKEYIVQDGDMMNFLFNV